MILKILVNEWSQTSMSMSSNVNITVWSFRTPGKYCIVSKTYLTQFEYSLLIVCAGMSFSLHLSYPLPCNLATLTGYTNIYWHPKKKALCSYSCSMTRQAMLLVNDVISNFQTRYLSNLSSGNLFSSTSAYVMSVLTKNVQLFVLKGHSGRRLCSLYPHAYRITHVNYLGSGQYIR